MKTFILLLFLIVLNNTFLLGQPYYFYVDTIKLEPQFPKTNDSIFIIASGDLSDTGSYVDSTYFETLNDEINITIDCGSGPGYPVFVPHDEIISLGFLDAGDYHINLYGLGLGDFVDDTTQYYFSVEESSSTIEIIDNKEILRIFPNPINDSRLKFEAENKRVIKEIYIYNSQSILCYSNNNINSVNYTIWISDWASGVYFVHYKIRDKSGVEKFVIR